VRALTLLHEDDRIVVCMKPPGLLTVKPPRHTSRRGEPTLVDRLRDQGFDLLPVHRLDQETSGVVLLARDQAARDALMEVFRSRAVSKTYIAVAQGRLDPAQGEFDAPIRDLGAKAEVHPSGQPALTHYRTLQTFRLATQVEIDLLTGRHNQIRIHFAHAGHPLVGERKYARGRDALIRHKRAALHASKISFTPPWASEPLTIEAPLPVDLENLLRKLA